MASVEKVNGEEGDFTEEDVYGNNVWDFMLQVLDPPNPNNQKTIADHIWEESKQDDNLAGIVIS